MLFKTTEEHEALRMQVREFVETEVKPIAAMLDKENKFPHEAIEKFGKNGDLWVYHIQRNMEELVKIYLAML